jgi:hypothetical protein
VISAEELDGYIRFAGSSELCSRANTSPTITESFSSLGFGDDAASSATYTHDLHAVSKAEAQSYYAGLPSEPTLLYHMGKEQWSPPRGPEAQHRLKELCEVWNHDLGWKVVKVEVDEAPEKKTTKVKKRARLRNRSSVLSPFGLASSLTLPPLRLPITRLGTS